MTEKQQAWIQYLDAKNRLEEQVHHGSPTQIADAERKLDRQTDAYAAACVAEARQPLVEALQFAHAHVNELCDAWERGAISERDGKGGLRSNRNAAVELKIRASLTAALTEPQP